MGFGLAKSPGQSLGSHGQGAVARIHQKAPAKEWNREVTAYGSDSDSFDEKNEVDAKSTMQGEQSEKASQQTPQASPDSLIWQTPAD